MPSYLMLRNSWGNYCRFITIHLMESIFSLFWNSRGVINVACFPFQTIPPIGKNSNSPTHEHELTSLSKEESQITSSRSSSGPNSPRNVAVGQVRGTQLSELSAFWYL